jgi:hypothetical protein
MMVLRQSNLNKCFYYFIRTQCTFSIVIPNQKQIFSTFYLLFLHLFIAMFFIVPITIKTRFCFLIVINFQPFLIFFNFYFLQLAFSELGSFLKPFLLLYIINIVIRR